MAAYRVIVSGYFETVVDVKATSRSEAIRLAIDNVSTLGDEIGVDNYEAEIDECPELECDDEDYE